MKNSHHQRARTFQSPDERGIECYLIEAMSDALDVAKFQSPDERGIECYGVVFAQLEDGRWAGFNPLMSGA